MAVAGRREWCRDRADILDIVEGAANLDRELLPESTVIVGGVCVLTEKRYSVRSPSCAAPLCVADAGRDTSTRGLGW
jgi:hypothetical protein